MGDVIDLNKAKNSAVKLYVGRQPWFTGKMGVYKKNIAIRIEDRIIQKDDKAMEALSDAVAKEAETEEIPEEEISPMNVMAQDIQDLLDPEPSLDDEE